MPMPVQQPIPSLGGVRVRYRPVMAVRLPASSVTRLFDGLIDSGADDTVFADSAATTLGLDLQGAEERSVYLVGRPRPIRVRYAPVQLLITDGSQETYQWSAVVGFVSGRLHYNLLGQAGFLQFFDCNLRGEPDYETVLAPKASFPGGASDVADLLRGRDDFKKQLAEVETRNKAKAAKKQAGAK